MKDKSDKEAKEAFSIHLARSGYVDVKIVKEPSDIIAYKDGVKYFFERRFPESNATDTISVCKHHTSAFPMLSAKKSASEENRENP